MSDFVRGRKPWETDDDSTTRSDSINKKSISALDEEYKRKIESILGDYKRSHPDVVDKKQEAEKATEEAMEETAKASDDVVEDAIETVEEAEEEAKPVEETAEEAVETAEETAEEAVETAEETAEEAVETAEETAEEAVETVEETVEEAVELVEETAEEAVETVEETAEETAESVEETAEEAVESVEETAEEAVETAEETVEETAVPVEETVEEAVESVEEPVEEAVEAVEEPTEETVVPAEEPAEEPVEPADPITEDELVIPDLSSAQDDDFNLEEALDFMEQNRKDNMNIVDDIEFISHDSVKDRSKMAKGKAISDDMVTEKKTTRRSVDKEAAKREKSLKMARKKLPLIIILIIIIIAAAIFGSSQLKKYMDKKSQENKEQPLSTQTYEKDEYEDINKLFMNYYYCYGQGETEAILQYAYPMSDSEKSYIKMYSDFVDQYQNITCYTKVTEDEQSYLVSVSYDVKLKGVDTTAPGMDTFYVTTAADGSVYIDNTYGPFNRSYQEYILDTGVLQMIQGYEDSSDIFALQAGVQSRYETQIAADENLKNVVEVDMAAAIDAWIAEHEGELQQKAQEAAAQVQAETPAEEAPAPAPEQAPAPTPEPAPAPTQTTANFNPQDEMPGGVTYTANQAWVHMNDTVYIRKLPSVESEALASAFKGSEVLQLGLCDNGWVRVKTGDVAGYVKAEYIVRS